MTDREMALALGEYIAQLLRRITILEGIVIEHGIVTPDRNSWEDLIKLVSHRDEIQRVFLAQLHGLEQAVPDGTPESELIRALYQHFVEP